MLDVRIIYFFLCVLILELTGFYFSGVEVTGRRTEKRLEDTLAATCTTRAPARSWMMLPEARLLKRSTFSTFAIVS